MNQNDSHIYEKESSDFINFLNIALSILYDITEKASLVPSENISLNHTNIQTYISESIEKIKNIQYELPLVSIADQKDLIYETTYSISELCNDIENALTESFKFLTENIEIEGESKSLVLLLNN